LLLRLCQTVSMQAANTGKTPGFANSAFWQLYYGPQTADTYSASATYYKSDIVVLESPLA
jgi:hypothetical protein